MADEEVRLTASMNDDLSAALDRIERRLSEVERKLLEVGAAGKVMGKEIDDGAAEAQDAIEDLGDEADKAKPKIKGLGDETTRTSTKSKRAKTDFDILGNTLTKLGKKAGGVGSILSAYKWAAIATGAIALAGGLSAIGAGAGIAIGGLAPMFGVLAGLAPLMVAFKLSTLAFKLASTQLSGPLTRMKQQFMDLGQEIADGGLGAGLDYMADAMRGLSRLTGKGLANIGADIGEAAKQTGDWISSAPFLEQVGRIFDGIRPIVQAVTEGLMWLAKGFVDLVEGSLPLGRDMAAMFRDMAISSGNWLKAQNESGRMTAWLTKSWDLFRRSIGVLVDFLIGLYRIFKIGGGYADEMGLSLEQAAARFRAWTGSAEGQERINKYFQDSLPALREMGKLLTLLLGGLGSLGASQDIAPLLNQIRTELAPAIGLLVSNLAGQGGLGPALIEAATAITLLFSNLDFSGLTLFAQLVADIAQGLLWMTANVPGANFVFSLLLGTMLGFKLMAPVFTMLGSGVKAFGWVFTALRGVSGLSKAQLVLKGAVFYLMQAFKLAGGAIITVIRAIGIAMMANPIMAAIMIIIGLILYLWFNCEWFRDGVIKIWEVISAAAVAAWNWIVEAVGTAIGWIVDKATWLWENGIKPIWEIIVFAAKAYWDMWVAIVKTAIDVIVTVVTWLWETIIKPIWDLIVAWAEVSWGIISGLVQITIYVIVGIISILAVVFKAIWDGIVAGAKWVFEEVITPLVSFFVDIFTTSVNWISTKWNEFTTALGLAWQLFYTVYLKPIIDGFLAAWNAVVTWITTRWTEFTTALGLAWQVFYATYLQPFFQFFTDAWNSIVTFASELWTGFVGGLEERWNFFTAVVGGVIDTVSGMWSNFTSWLTEVFTPVGDVLTGVWEGIKTAASAAAEIVKGAWDTVVGAVKGVWNAIANGWNSIPSITVPDYVPGIGGQTFSLPKLPMLWHGGETPGGLAVVGEHGPEPLIRGGRMVGMLGTNGPEIANLPKGGYVVPNLSTLAAMPGLAKSLPPSVAAAVAAGMPSYRPMVAAGGGDRALLGAVRELTAAVRSQAPPITATGPDVRAEVLDALRTRDRETAIRKSYSYQAGRG